MSQAAKASTTRRALLGAAPVIALAAAPAVAAVNPDAELLALAAEWRALDAKVDSVEAQAEALDVASRYPPLPEALHWRESDFYLRSHTDKTGERMSWAAIDRHREARGKAFVGRPEELNPLYARIEEVIEAERAHAEACAQVRKSSGYDRLCNLQANTVDQMSEIELRIAQLPARTDEGRKFKAELVKRYGNLDGDENYADHFILSLLRDMGVA